MMALSFVIRNLLPGRGSSLLGPSCLVPSRIFAEQIYENQKDQGLTNYVPARGAARKGKRIQRAREARERANKRRLLEAQNPKLKKDRKKTVKVDKEQFRFATERQLDMTLPNPPEDDVYFVDKFRKRRLSFDEIIELHRQAVHPDILNVPDALLTATIELNLKMKIKKKRYIDVINSTVCYPNIFQYEIRPRKIVALCKDVAEQNLAKEAGAYMAGALDIATLLKTNQLTQRDFDHIVCKNDFLLEFSTIKGMKSASYFPSKQRGNFGDDIVELVKYFKNGVDYSLKKNPDEPEHGFIDCYFGKLNMTNEQLRDNLMTLFESVNRFKPLNLADGKQFFQRVHISTPANEEMFFLKFWEMAEDYVDPDAPEEESEEGQDAKAVGA